MVETDSLIKTLGAQMVCTFEIQFAENHFLAQWDSLIETKQQHRFCKSYIQPVKKKGKHPYLFQQIDTHMYDRSKKKRITLIYFNTNYRAEMKLVPIIMDYCLLQFDALKFFLEVLLHGGFLSNFNFFNANPQIFQRNRKGHPSYLLGNKFSQRFKH